MTSSSTGMPKGRLATPYTNRTDFLSAPNTSQNSSEGASATVGWSKKSPDVASMTPSRTTPYDAVQRTQPLLRDRQSVERRQARRRSTLFYVELGAQATAVFRLVPDGRLRAAQKEQVAGLAGLNQPFVRIIVTVAGVDHRSVPCE
jgi:hypothetical protein